MRIRSTYTSFTLFKKHGLLFMAVVFLLSHFNSYAVTITAAQSGPWSATTTWTGGVVPVAANDVMIKSGYTVTVDVTTAVCTNLGLGDNGAGGGDGTLIFNPGTVVTATGALTCGQGGSLGFIDMTNGGTFICATWSSQRNGSGLIPGIGKVKLTGTSTLFNDTDWSVFYDLEIASGTTTLGYSNYIVWHNLTLSGTGILDENGMDLQVQGDWIQSGTASFTEGTAGTVTFNGTGSQAITNTATETFYNLKVNKASGTLTASCNISVTALLTMTSGTFVIGTNTLSGAGGLTATGGDLQIAKTAVATQPELAGAYAITGGTVTLNGAGNQTLRPSVSYYSVVLGNSGIKTTTTVTVYAGDLTISGSATMATNGAFTVTGTLFYTSSGSTTLTAATNVSIGNYQQSNGILTDNGVNITVTGTTWNRSAGTFTSTGRVLFQGTANQTVTNSGGQTYANVTINNGTVTNTITLSGAVTVTVNITFTSGQLITSTTDILILNSGTTVSSASGNSFVNGAVKKTTAAATVFTFPLGDNNAYLPIEITPSSAVATTWIGQYNYNNQPVTALATFPTLDHISNAEYWMLNRTAGTADAVVKLYWNSNSFVSATGADWTNLRVSQFDGTNFVALGTTQSGGNAQAAGSIYTSGNVTNFTANTFEYFTIGSTNTTNELGRTRYSVGGGTANWTGAIWATRSGGAATASVPAASNDVYIEAGMTVQVTANQACRMLTIGAAATTGTLEVNTNNADITVGLGGVNITSNGDVTGTSTGNDITSTGDVILNKVISHTSLTLTAQTTAALSLSGTGGVPNLTNTSTLTNTGNITVSGTLTTSATLTNNGTLTGATVTANNTLTNNSILNITSTINGTNNMVVNGATGTINFTGCTVSKTIDFTTTGNTLKIDNTSASCGASWAFTAIAKNQTFYNLIISNTAAKKSSSSFFINNDLTIQSGAVLDVATNGNDIVIGGNWINNDGSAGSFLQGTRRVSFGGSSNQTITNTSGETFYHLMVNNAGGEVILGGSAVTTTVSNLLTMTLGNINLNGNTLTLGTAAATPGTLTYTDGIIYTNTASGGFTRWVSTGSSLSATTGLFPIGSSTEYAPMVITSTAAPTTGGTITAYYKDVSYTTAVSPTFVDNTGTVSLMDNLSYVVSQSSLVLGGGQSFSMKLSGTSYGTVGDVNDLRIILRAGTIAPGSDGVHGGTTLIPQVNRTALNPADLNNSFTIGSVNTVRSPLPIELLSFTADAVNNSFTKVKWTTATEINNDFFTIQKSIDGINFEKIDIVKGAGNSTSVLDYSTDDDNPYKGVSYYRLKQTDFDGKSTYSNTIAVEFNGKDDFIFKVFPNPSAAGENLNLAISGSSSEEVLVVVYDMTGKESFSKVIVTQNNDNEVYALDPSNKLSPGVYMITATSDQAVYSKRLIVK